MVLRQIKAHAFGFGRDPSGEPFHTHLLTFTKRCCGDGFCVQALERFHAGEQARLQVLDFAGVGKPARQLHKRAFHYARAFAEVALF